MSVSYSRTVGEVRKAFEDGKTRPLEWRVKQLKALERMYEENGDLFCEALYKDLRKPRVEAMTTELDFLKNDLLRCQSDIYDWTKAQSVPKSLVTMMDKGLIVPEPYGVVLIMGAWNYPLQLTLAPLAGAISAGNAAVIKPSEVSAHTASVLEKVLPKYLDKECFRVVTGGIPETTALLKERFDYVFFTGAPHVGRIVRDAVNKYLTPCTLELGGKSPCYVDDSADIGITAKRLVWGKMTNAGQTCVAPDYVLCSKSVEKKLVPELRKVVSEWYGQSPQESSDMGRIVSDRHFDRLVKMVEATKGNIVMGGQSDRSERYVDLTVVTDVDPSADALMQDEIFGPLLPIVTADTVNEAIDLVNSKEKPLTLYVYSSRTKVQDAFVARTSSGGVAVNDCLIQLAVQDYPFGGVGNSGMGKYHGKSTFDTFTHYKPVLIRDFNGLFERLGAFRYPPLTDSNLSMGQMLLKHRNLPPFNAGYVCSFLLGAVVTAAGMAAVGAGLWAEHAAKET